MNSGKGYLILGGIAVLSAGVLLAGIVSQGSLGAFLFAAGVNLAAGAVGILCVNSIQKSWGVVPAAVFAGMIRVLFVAVGFVTYLAVCGEELFVFMITIAAFYLAILLGETVFAVHVAGKFDFESEGGV